MNAGGYAVPGKNTPITMTLTVKNPVLNAVSQGHFDQAIELFFALKVQTPEDRLWFAHALLSTGQAFQALEQALAARGVGLEDAAAFAVSVYRTSGEIVRARAILDSIEVSRLSVFGQALFACERGILIRQDGHLREAVGFLDSAVELAMTDPITGCFLAQFATHACDAHERLGRDVRVLQLVSFTLTNASPAQAARLHLMRAVAFANIGKFADSDVEMDAANALASTLAKPTISYYRAAHQALRGLNVEAAIGWMNTTQEARAACQTEVEAYAEIGLARLSTLLDDVPLARAHLARAQTLVEGVALHAELALAQGALLARQNDNKALELLEAAVRGFEELEIERDAGLACLHLAEAQLRLGQHGAVRQTLERAMDARYSVGSGARFASELRALPAVFEYLINESGSMGEVKIGSRSMGKPRNTRKPYLAIFLEDWRTLEAHAPRQVSITTLGGYNLTLDGERPRLASGLARTVELLAFLLENGPAKLEAIQANVFEDDPPGSSRKYMQTIRAAVKKALPSLSLPYEPINQTYWVQSEGVRLHWDVSALREALRMGGEFGLQRALALYTGPFLPRVSHEWVANLRAELEADVSRLGIEILEDLERRGEFESCIRMADRLLEVHALSPVVALILFRATLASRGPMIARSVLDALKGRFILGIGEVPEDLLLLEQKTSWMVN
jgi:DNA-binding SARP family transcriptional activator